MAKRTIEETFQTIKPKGQKGQKAPIGVSVASNNTDLSTSLSQAGQQIAQLQSTYQAQASLITANTQAIQGNTSAQSSKSAGSVAGGIASSLFGGLGLLSPLLSGIAGLFGGNSTPAPLPYYKAPSPVAISATLNSAAPNSAPAQNGGPSAQSPAGSLPAPAAPAPQSVAVSLLTLAAPPQNAGPSPQSPAGGILAPAGPQASPPAPAAPQASQAAPAAPQVIVNVTAMDSQSFMDHSTDIANAVREAMLNMHPINGVVATL